jgi:ATP-dependent helicase/nuclease subunit A
VVVSLVTDVPQLAGAQARIREAFFEHETGLFVLACTAGFGKSTTAERIAAESLCVAAREDTPCPEEHLAVVSFARDDAATIEPGLDEALDAFADDGTATDRSLDAATANRIQRGLRQSDYIGTIDSVLRSVFADIATELGFDEMPTVGNEALLASLRRDCLKQLRENDAYTELFERLEAAYADGDATTVDDLLDDGRKAKRDQRLTAEGFRDRLADTVEEAYPAGTPSTLADVRNDIRQFYGSDAADAFEPTDTPARTVRRDEKCYEQWGACVDAFTALVTAYERAYDSACRERGVIAHCDVAYWIAAFFEADSDELPEVAQTTDERVREQIRRRHAKHFQTLVIDEAQDVSVVQHDALAVLVPNDARVLLAGDTNQCIYGWRNARPTLFARAFDTGRYFHRDWGVHEREQAAKTYRMRPDITAAVDTVFRDVFTDRERGAVESLAKDYPLVTTDREPSQTPAVHVSSYHANGVPGSENWFETGEADTLASYLHSALTTDEFDAQDGSAAVTVLFPRRSNMDTLEQRLQERGLTVANASQQLFATPLVELVCAVVDWLVDPFDPERTRDLFDDEACAFLRTTPEESPINHSPKEVVADNDYQLPAMTDETAFPPASESFIDGLRTLATRQARHASDPGTLVLEEIIATLELAADPLGLVGDAERCLTTIDALLDHVGEWEGTDRYTIDDLAAICNEYRRDPKHGPTVPVLNTGDYDVVFRTIHNMKGDEASVVCLADLSKPVGAFGPHSQTFLAHDELLALAPPETENRIQVGHNEPGDRGESTPLRWGANQWVGDQLAGSPSLRTAGAAHRADRWRLLYVAMTRARDHLVVSLPRERAAGPQAPRNNWVGTLHDALALERAPSRGRHELQVQRAGGQTTLTVDINNVPFDPPPKTPPSRPVPRAAVPPSPVQTRRTPRFISGSILNPLATEFDRYWLPYLQGRPLHTERAEPDTACNLPFDAIGPDLLGTIAHGVLTTAIREDVATETLRRCAGPLQNALHEPLTDNTRSVGTAERHAVETFVSDTLCPQFATTATWARLKESEATFIEETVDTFVDIGGLSIETQNHVDIVSVAADGTWYVDDLKVALTTPDERMRRRHNAQIEFYVWALARQLPQDVDIEPTLTYLGHTVQTHQPPVLDDEIQRQLAQLRSR